MKIIEYDSKESIIEASKKLNKESELFDSGPAISFRIFENRQTTELHIYKKKIYR